MRLKLLAGAGLGAALLIAAAGPAFAHVTTDPSSAPQGGEITLRFRVPNEVASANVVKVDVAFPTDHPLLGVDTEAIAGWTSTVTETKLNPPVQTDDGPVAEAVSEIVWTAGTGGGTPPGQFQEFSVLVQQLPSDTDQVVFKALQTYSDGSIVRWIDPVTSDHPDPDNPTPILTLTPADTNGAGANGTGTAAPPPAGTPTTAAGAIPPAAASPAASPTVDAARLATKGSVSTANAYGLIGIVIGAIGLIVAVLAIRKRPTATPAARADAPNTPAAGADGPNTPAARADGTDTQAARADAPDTPSAP
jgi:uncharacterized protein YcnI